MSRASLDKKPREVASMFDAVARRYDLTNDVMTAGLHRGWRRATVAALDAQPGERILDIGAGTGFSSEPYHDREIEVVPADFSYGMLAEGRRRRPDMPFTAADATALPFADASFDAVVTSYAVRNVVDPRAAFREFRRVVRPGGRLVVLEFSTPTSPLLRTAYQKGALAALPHIARRTASDPESYVYLAESIQAWPDQAGVARMLREAGWQEVSWRDLTGGIAAVHRGVAGPAAG